MIRWLYNVDDKKYYSVCIVQLSKAWKQRV